MKNIQLVTKIWIKQHILSLYIKAKSLTNIILKCLPNTNFHMATILQRKKICPETAAQRANSYSRLSGT